MLSSRQGNSGSERGTPRRLGSRNRIEMTSRGHAIQCPYLSIGNSVDRWNVCSWPASHVPADRLWNVGIGRLTQEMHMAKKGRIVFQNDDGQWSNKKIGNQRASGNHDTQKQARDEATRQLKKEGGGELTVMGRDGKIVSKDTIGRRDPNPPKDKEH